jgi:hypothetical protein
MMEKEGKAILRLPQGAWEPWKTRGRKRGTILKYSAPSLVSSTEVA